MVMHVKEPLPAEYDLIRKDQIVFTYLHLAAAVIRAQNTVLCISEMPSGSRMRVLFLQNPEAISWVLAIR